MQIQEGLWAFRIILGGSAYECMQMHWKTASPLIIPQQRLRNHLSFWGGGLNVVAVYCGLASIIKYFGYCVMYLIMPSTVHLNIKSLYL